MTLAEYHKRQAKVVEILKARFQNLSAEQVVELVQKILEAALEDEVII